MSTRCAGASRMPATACPTTTTAYDDAVQRPRRRAFPGRARGGGRASPTRLNASSDRVAPRLLRPLHDERARREQDTARRARPSGRRTSGRARRRGPAAIIAPSTDGARSAHSDVPATDAQSASDRRRRGSGTGRSRATTRATCPVASAVYASSNQTDGAPSRTRPSTSATPPRSRRRPRATRCATATRSSGATRRVTTVSDRTVSHVGRDRRSA